MFQFEWVNKKLRRTCSKAVVGYERGYSGSGFLGEIDTWYDVVFTKTKGQSTSA